MKISLYLLSLLEMFLWVLKLESFSVDYLKLMTQQQQKFFECQYCVLDYFRLWELEMWIRYRLWSETVKTHGKQYRSVQFSSVAQPCPIFAIPWITACQASRSITNSWGLLKLMAIESVRPSSHLILCRPLLLLPPVPSSIRVFQWVNPLHEVAKVLQFQPEHQPFQWITRTAVYRVTNISVRTNYWVRRVDTQSLCSWKSLGENHTMSWIWNEKKKKHCQQKRQHDYQC